MALCVFSVNIRFLVQDLSSNFPATFGKLFENFSEVFRKSLKTFGVRELVIEDIYFSTRRDEGQLQQQYYERTATSRCTGCERELPALPPSPRQGAYVATNSSSSGLRTFKGTGNGTVPMWYVNVPYWYVFKNGNVPYWYVFW